MFMILMSLFMGFFMCFIIFERISNKPNIATVNVNSIIKNYVQNQSRLDIDQEVLEKNTRSFVHQLEKEIEILSDDKDTLLFVSEAILAGAKDYTPEIEKKVYRTLDIPKMFS